MNSPDSIQMIGNAATRPSRWLALPALLTAPLVAAIMEIFFFTIGARVAGYQPVSPSLRGLGSVYSVFALVFIPLGGLLMFIFWRRAPFGPILSSAFGVVCGALLGLIAVAIVFHEVEQSLLLVAATLGLGMAGGVSGGLTIWLICRLGSHGQND